VERQHNLGLAASMRAGVTALCDEHGRAIILEDDLEVSPSFLRFMNDSLDSLCRRAARHGRSRATCSRWTSAARTTRCSCR